MFQFTTTNVVNTPWWNGFTTDDEYSYSPSDKNSEHALFTAEDGYFYVKGVNNFLKENIIKVYKAEARPSEKAKVVFDFDKIQNFVDSHDKATKKGDIFRVNVYIGLSQGSNDAMYANDFYFKGKPLMIDFVWLGSKQETVQKLLKTIKRFGLAFEGEKMVEVSLDGNSLVLEAVNEYQRFVKADIEKLDSRAYNGIGDWESVDNVVSERVEGKEGFGTYSWILHNLRIPTSARDSMFAQNVEETPIVGGLYDQYTIHYCKNRGSLGLNAVGDQTTSHTTHVFYVLKNECPNDISSDFTAALESACGGISFEQEKDGSPVFVLDPNKAAASSEESEKEPMD